jgi:hypothetical protein
MDYLEEEDLTAMTVKVEPKKTPGQSIRQTKQARELEMNIEAEKLLVKEEEDELLKLSGQEKEKTIKCLLKVLSYQVQQVEQQASDVLTNAQ